jgi:hypothetical protein
MTPTITGFQERHAHSITAALLRKRSRDLTNLSRGVPSLYPLLIMKNFRNIQERMPGNTLKGVETHRQKTCQAQLYAYVNYT